MASTTVIPAPLPPKPGSNNYANVTTVAVSIILALFVFAKMTGFFDKEQSVSVPPSPLPQTVHVHKKYKPPRKRKPRHNPPTLGPLVEHTYKYHSNKNSLGRNIYQYNQYKNNVDQLKKKCNMIERCKGFNTNGWLKYSLKPKERWTNWGGNNTSRGFYVKGLVPTIVPTIVPTVVAPTVVEPDPIVAEISVTEEPPTPIITTVANIQEGSISTAVEADEASAVVVIDPVNNTPIAVPAALASATTAAENYTFYQNKDSRFGELLSRSDLADNATALKAECDELEACKGFNTDGWLKAVIKPQEEWSNFGTGHASRGLYVKSGVDVVLAILFFI